MKERWDAYDEHLNKLEIDLIRGETIPAGMFYLAVSIWTVFNNKILVTRRDYSKTFSPGLLEVTGGAILKGEEPLQAAVRELREETGIKINEDELHYLHMHKYPYQFMHEYYHVLDKEPEIKLLPGETIEYYWMDFNEIDQRMEKGEFAEAICERYQAHKENIKAIIK